MLSLHLFTHELGEFFIYTGWSFVQLLVCDLHVDAEMFRCQRTGDGIDSTNVIAPDFKGQRWVGSFKNCSKEANLSQIIPMPFKCFPQAHTKHVLTGSNFITSLISFKTILVIKVLKLCCEFCFYITDYWNRIKCLKVFKIRKCIMQLALWLHGVVIKEASAYLSVKMAMQLLNNNWYTVWRTQPHSSPNKKIKTTKQTKSKIRQAALNRQMTSWKNPEIEVLFFSYSRHNTPSSMPPTLFLFLWVNKKFVRSLEETGVSVWLRMLEVIWQKNPVLPGENETEGGQRESDVHTKSLEEQLSRTLDVWTTRYEQVNMKSVTAPLKWPGYIEYGLMWQ